MNTNDYNTEPTHEPNAAEPSAKQKEAEPSGAGGHITLFDLAREVLALVESGKNESRLRQLLLTLDAERLQQINKNLAMLEKEDLSRLLELKQSCDELIQPFKAALSRTDLTIPEMLFLGKLSARQIHQEEKLLVAEKERIEQKRRPGMRRRRGTN